MCAHLSDGYVLRQALASNAGGNLTHKLSDRLLHHLWGAIKYNFQTLFSHVNEQGFSLALLAWSRKLGVVSSGRQLAPTALILWSEFRERFYSLYQTRRVSRAEPNKNLTKK